MATQRVFTDMPRSGYIEYFNDFFSYAAGDWVITTTEAGTGAATEAVSDERGGVLVITNDDADNDNDFLQFAGGAGNVIETFKFLAGKRLMFKTRFKVSDATDSDFVIGLQPTDTTPLAVTDGIYFQSDDGDASLDFHVAKDSTATDVEAIATLEDDTYVDLEFYYDGAGNKVMLYVNGSVAGNAVLTNVPDDEELAISFGIQNGEAAAKIMSIDYIHVVQER